VLTEGCRVWRAKSPTTPGEIGKGVLAAVRLASERRGESLARTMPKVVRFGLGTTAITNVLASKTGRRVGLLTTAGFEEMIPFARGSRVVNEAGWLVTPPSMIDLSDIVGIKERVDRDGCVIKALDPAATEAAIRHLVEERKVEALVVSFLWGFRFPAHEQFVVRMARAGYPGLSVFSAGELHPAAREYERTSYALLTAYVSNALGGIDELAADLSALGLQPAMLLVHSQGGSMSVAEAKSRPLSLAVSGPSAGVAACVTVAKSAGIRDIVTCDLGGTSFDVSVIINGEPASSTRGEVMGMWTALRQVDVKSIGSGGGSIGWIDARGLLRVGPKSAGSVPGPACYGWGGTSATLTDALVVLGYIDPDRFLGGDFKLDLNAARKACAALGAQLNMAPESVAWGIRALALADMIKATRARAGILGLDLRGQAFISFGGSGSLFTPDIADAVGAHKVLVPELASVLSAFGAATTDIRRERIYTVMASFPIEPDVIATAAAQLSEAVSKDLAADGVAAADRSVTFEADLRYAKQISEIAIALDAEKYGVRVEGAMIESFAAEYSRRHGQGALALGAPVELVTLRAVGIGRTARAELNSTSGESVPDGTIAAKARRRSVRLERGEAGRRDVDVYDGQMLRPGHSLNGPALIDARDTTIWIPGTARASVSPHGTLIMEIAK
jgi:N-methylhydantoinase A